MTQPSYPGSPIEPEAFTSSPQAVPPPGVSSTRGLAIAASLVAVVFALFEVFEVPFAFAAQDDYLEAADQGLDSSEVFTSYDLFALPWMLVIIAAYVVTCLWLYQVRSNFEVMHPGIQQARSKGWIWGGWLVPVVNLWFPFQIVRDVSKGPRDTQPTTTLLGWWWTFWVLWAISSRIGPGLTGFGEIDTGAIEALGIVEGVNAAITLVALVLWLAVIRRLKQPA